MRHLAGRVRPVAGDATALSRLMDFLRRKGAIPVEKKRSLRLTPVEQCVQAFERYLREERGLANATILYYANFIRSFLNDRFGARSVTLGQLCGSDVVKFVQREAPRLHLKRARLLTTALRAFLQYARYRGYLTRDLTGAVPLVANWTMTTIPRAIPEDQVKVDLEALRALALPWPGGAR